MLNRRQGAVATVVIASAGAAGAILWFGRDWTFFYDEWGTILYRREGGFSAFFAPHNGHLQAVVIAVYRVLFATFGLGSYTPYQVVSVALHVLSGVLLFVYARRRIDPFASALLAVLFLFLGEAWEVLFWPINIGFIIPLAVLLTVFVLRDQGTRREPVATAGLLLVALASSGLGVAIAIVVGVDTLLSRRTRAAIMSVAAPAVAYVAWFALYRPVATTPGVLRHIPGADPDGDLGQVGFRWSNLDEVPEYVAKQAQAALTGLLGAHRQLDGVPLAVAVILAVGVLVFLWRGERSPRAVAIGAGAVTMWTMTALARAHVQQPASSRYIYPGALLLMLLAIELTPERRLPWPALTALGLIVALAVSAGVSDLRRAGRFAETAFAAQSEKLTSIECAEPPPSSDHMPDSVQLPGVSSGPYRAAVRDLGSPIGGCD